MSEHIVQVKRRSTHYRFRTGGLLASPLLVLTPLLGVLDLLLGPITPPIGLRIALIGLDWYVIVCEPFGSGLKRLPIDVGRLEGRGDGSGWALRVEIELLEFELVLECEEWRELKEGAG